MGQKVNIPSQNQPFRRQASIGGNVSFRNIGDNNDNSFIALAKVTRVYYQRGKLDFKLTNTNSLVADRSGNGSGSAPIPVDFFGRRKNGQVFGHYRPVKIGDLIAVAYVNGHKSSPIVIGVYPNSGQDYEIISPSLYLDGDDEDAGVAETALAEQKIYPSMQLEYRSGSGTIAKALNGHSFLTVDDETSHQYDKLWQNYDTVGFFHNSSDAINPLKETAGDWLLVHEDNPLSDDGDNHRTRFFVNKKGEIQIVLMDNTSAGTISVLEGSKQDGFTISQYYDLQAKKSGDLSDDVYEPDFKSATNYVSLNVGKDQEIALEVAAKNSSKLELKSDGLYLNGKPFVESLNQRLDDLSDNIKKDIHQEVPSNSDFKELADSVSENAQAARDAAESARQAGESAKDAGLAAEKAGEDAKETGDDIKSRIIYYSSISKEKDVAIPGKYIIINTDTYIANGTIKNAYIEDGAIDHAKIANEAVGSSQIEDAAITRAKIANLAVGSAQIEDASITNEKVGKLSFDHMIGATLDAGKINVINLTAESIKADTITADKLNIKGLSDITSNAGTISKGRIQAGDDPNSGVVIDNLDADNPNKYTPAKKAFLLSEVKKLNSAAEAAIDYGEQTHTDYSAVEKAKKAMDDGLAPLLGDMATTTEFDYNTVIKLEQDLQDAVNAFHSKTNSDIMAQIGTTADGKNAIYRGANDPVTMGVQPHENDMWLQILSNGTYNIRVWDGAQWINPGLADIKAVSDSLSNLPKSYYQPEEPVGGDVHDGDTWYKLTKGSDGNYTYVVYKRESGQWVQLLDSNDVTNQTTINNLNTSLSKLPQSYYSSTQPTGTDYKDGDIWYKISTNTTNNTVVYTPFKWNPNTNTWDPMLDATSSHNYIGSAPVNPINGDFWMDNTTLKQYQNGAWKTIPTQGPQGVPGVSAKQQYIHIAYATSANGTENFSNSTFSGATYIGLLVDFNEEDSKDHTKYTWSRLRGADGTDGKDGVPGKPGVDGKTSYVHFAYANSSDGKTGFNLVYFNGAKYIGIYSDFTEADSDDYTKYTWSEFRGQDGQDGTNGKDGVPGTNGKDGKDGETSYIHTAYANSSDGKNSFSLKYFTNALYIGMYTDFNEADSDDYTKYTWSRLKGNDGTDGKDGVPGAKGADGRTSYVHFAYANSSDGNTNFNLEYFANALYIGTYTDFNESDSSEPTKYTWSRLKGDPGANGKDGVAGKDGVGLKRTEVTYGLSESDSTQPSRWSSQVPDLVKGQYLWSKTVWTYTDDTSETGYQKTYIAKDGNDGTDGIAGKDGVGINSTTITYAVGTSGTTAPISGWDSQVPNVPAGQYLWTKTIWSYTDNTNETGYSVAKMGDTGPKGDPGKDGVPGPKGADGKTYYTWIKYATDSSGSNISDSPIGMSYIGIAYNKESPTESSTATDYEWTKIKGDDGIPGAPGADGKTSYFHVAYANSADGKDGFYVGGGTNLLTNTDKDISVTSHTTEGWPAWANIDTGFSFEHGKTYTFSAEAKNSTDKIAEASIRVFEGSTNTQVGIYAFPADGKRHSVTFTIPNDSHDYHLLLYAGHAGIVPGVDVTTTYHHSKLEEGNVSTPWSPAPSEAHPLYMGTYTDYTRVGSTDPTRYTWVPMFDSTKKRNFTSQPTTPYAVGDTWTESGATYFCTTARDSGAFRRDDWTMQQLTIQSLAPSVTNSLYNDNLLTGTSEDEKSGKSYNFADYQISGGLQPGTTYTLSGWARVDQDSLNHHQNVFVCVYSEDWSWGATLNINSALTSQYNKITFTTPNGKQLHPSVTVYLSHPDGGTDENDNDSISGKAYIKKLKLEKGSVATPWCLSQSELTTTTRDYKGVTLNDRGLTATAGSTTVAMNSNAGFLINNPKYASADNPGGQVFHVDTDGNLTISGSLTSSATISGVNFTGQNLTLSGSMKLTGDNSAISSNHGDVVFNKNGIIATSGPITVTINGTDPLRIQSNNNDIFKVDTDGNLTISGSLTSSATISGVNFTGDSLTLSGSMKVNGQILFANGAGVLSSQGLSLKGGGLSISDSQGNQTTYIKPDGTFTTNKGYFEGDITAHKLILDSSTSSINMGGGVFKVNSKGDVTANSFTATDVKITGGQYMQGTFNSPSIQTGNIYSSNIYTATLHGGQIIGNEIIGSGFRSNSIQTYLFNREHIYADSDGVAPTFYINPNGTTSWGTSIDMEQADPNYASGYRMEFINPVLRKDWENLSPFPLDYITDSRGNGLITAGDSDTTIGDGTGRQEIKLNQGNNRTNGSFATEICKLWKNYNESDIDLNDKEYQNAVDEFTFKLEYDLSATYGEIQWENISNIYFSFLYTSAPLDMNDAFTTDLLQKITPGLNYITSDSKIHTYTEKGKSINYIVGEVSNIRTTYTFSLYEEQSLKFSDLCGNDKSPIIYVYLVTNGLADTSHEWYLIANKYSMEHKFTMYQDAKGYQHIIQSNFNNPSSQAVNITPNGVIRITGDGNNIDRNDMDGDDTDWWKTTQTLEATAHRLTLRDARGWTTITPSSIGFSAYQDGYERYPRLAFSGYTNNDGIYFDSYGNIHAARDSGLLKIYGNESTGYSEVFHIPLNNNDSFDFNVPRSNRGGLQIGWVYFDNRSYSWAGTVPAIYNVDGRIKGFAMFDQYIISFVDGWCYQLASWWNHGVPKGVNSSNGESIGINTQAGHRGT